MIRPSAGTALRSAGRHLRKHPALTAVCVGAALASLCALGPGSAAALAGIPTMTRAEIIARAESGLGTNYTWGGESWTPDTGSGAGPDCSGYGLKCWEVPKTLLYQEENGVNATISPRYTSYSFYNCVGPWYELTSRSLLREGDILVKNNGTSGHVTIYAGGDAWNSPVIYEAPGTGLEIRRISRYLGSEYKPIRRESLADGIILDNPSAKSIGGPGAGGNWSRSTNVSGYYGDDYQSHAPTSDSVWARWTPRLPSTGYYEIFLRWTAGSDRASGLMVTVNTPSGQYKRFINQRINGGKWFSLGQYSFRAGYAPATGSITMYATGADGYVIADAVQFVYKP